jgi:hypothetical protein
VKGDNWRLVPRTWAAWMEECFYGARHQGTASLSGQKLTRTSTNHRIFPQVQRQEKALAQDPYRYLSDSPTMPEQDAHVRGRPSHHNYHFNQLSDRTGEIETAGMAWHC